MGAPAVVIVLLMGVSGSGKTTVGQRLASALGWQFRDADEFHPPANIKKMSAGLPLADADRAPWLAAIRAYIDDCLARGESAVVTCSALKERYRRAILTDAATVKLVYLAGDFALLETRLQERPGHFMKAGMLESQFADLEPPSNAALTLTVGDPPDALVTQIRAAFGL